MESYVYGIQSLKLCRPPSYSPPKATTIKPKTSHALQLRPALLGATVRCRSVTPDDRDRGLKLDHNRRISQQSRRRVAPEATAPDKPNPDPAPDPAEPRVSVSDEEDGDDEADSRSAKALEHLVEEAITGDDMGRDAVDYERRALLFDKSSQVVLDLKERDQFGGP